MIIEELVALLGFELKGEGALKRFRDGIEGASKALVNFARQAALLSAAAGSAIGAGLAFIGKGAIKTGAEFEALGIRLETLEGSSAKAKQALDWIRNFAATTPLDLAQAADAYANLKNYGLDPTAGSLQALVDAMSASGKGVAQLDRLVLALGQAWTKTKLQGGEILQLTEAGIPVWEMLAEATGKSVVELQKLSAAGKLGREEIQLLIDAIGKKYAGASEKFAKSYQGIMDKIGEQWTDFQKAVADAGFFDWFKNTASEFLGALDQLWKSGSLDKLARKISDTLVESGELLKATFKGITLDTFAAVIEGAIRFFTAMIQVASSVQKAIAYIGSLVAKLLGLKNEFAGVMIVLGAVAAIVAPWATAFAALALIVDDFIAWLQDDQSIIGSVLDWLSGKFEAWGSTVEPQVRAVAAAWESLKGVVAALTQPIFEFIDGFSSRMAAVDWSSKFDQFVGALGNTWEGIKKLGGGFVELGDAINRLFASATGDGTAANAISTLANLLGDLVGSAIVAGLEGVVGTLQNLAIALGAWGEALSKVAQGDLLGAFSALGQGIIDIAANIAASLERMFQAFVPSFSFETVADELDRLFGAWNAIGQGIINVASDIAAAVEKMFQAFVPSFSFETIADELDRLFDYILAWFDSISLYDVGARLMTSLFDGMKSIGAAIRDWFSSLIPEWARGWVVNTGPVETPSSTAVDPSQMHNRFAPANSNIATDAQQNLDKVTGDQAIDQTVNQVANDNRVTNVEVNAPVSIHATTNATAGELGSMAGNAVRSAGRDATRSLAVTGAAGGGGPR